MKRYILIGIINFFFVLLSLRSHAELEKGQSGNDLNTETNKETLIESIRKVMENSESPKIENKSDDDSSLPYIKVIPGAESRNTIIYKFRNIKSKTAIDAIEGLSSISGTVEEISEQNIIMINDSDKRTDEIKEALIAIDVPLPQILVEAKVIEIYVDDGMERDLQFEYQKTDPGDGLNQSAGFTLNAPGQNTLSNQGGIMDLYPYSSGFQGRTVKDINIFLRWLKKARDAKTLSSPNLIVDLGATASIVTGEDVPIIQTQVNGGTVTTSTLFKRIGVKLNVTPVLINKNNVRLKINPEVSSIIRYETFTQNNLTVNNPVVSIRNIETELVAEDNSFVLIGGLYSSEKIKSSRKVPFIGEIPLLGELFTSVDESDVKKQLVFFMKIKILEPGSKFLVNDIEKSAEDINKIGEEIRDSEKIFPPQKLKGKGQE